MVGLALSICSRPNGHYAPACPTHGAYGGPNPAMTQGRGSMPLRNGESCVTESGADAFRQVSCEHPAPGIFSAAFSVRRMHNQQQPRAKHPADPYPRVQRPSACIRVNPCFTQAANRQLPNGRRNAAACAPAAACKSQVLNKIPVWPGREPVAGPCANPTSTSPAHSAAWPGPTPSLPRHPSPPTSSRPRQHVAQPPAAERTHRRPRCHRPDQSLHFGPLLVDRRDHRTHRHAQNPPTPPRIVAGSPRSSPGSRPSRRSRTDAPRARHPAPAPRSAGPPAAPAPPRPGRRSPHDCSSSPPKREQCRCAEAATSPPGSHRPTTPGARHPASPPPGRDRCPPRHTAGRARPAVRRPSPRPGRSRR